MFHVEHYLITKDILEHHDNLFPVGAIHELPIRISSEEYHLGLDA